MHLVHDCFMSTIDWFLNLILIPTAHTTFTWKHKITHAVNVTIHCCISNITGSHLFMHWKSRSLLQRTRQKKVYSHNKTQFFL